MPDLSILSVSSRWLVNFSKLQYTSIRGLLILKRVFHRYHGKNIDRILCKIFWTFHFCERKTHISTETQFSTAICARSWIKNIAIFFDPGCLGWLHSSCDLSIFRSSHANLDTRNRKFGNFYTRKGHQDSAREFRNEWLMTLHIQVTHTVACWNARSEYIIRLFQMVR